MTDALVEVATARDRFEGDLLVALLESEGIEALLFVDDAAQMYGSLGQIEPVTIRVRAEDAEAARQVLEQRDVTPPIDRKSTRLNSSHVKISYAVFCLKKKIDI